VSLVGGCGVINWLFPGLTETGSSKLVPFASEKELADYLTGEIQTRTNSSWSFDRTGVFLNDGVLSGDAEAPSSPAPDSGAGSGQGTDQTAADNDSFSGTTLQEVGVDEADVVKTDGDYVYVIDYGNNGDSVLRIVSIDPAGPMSVVSETALDGYGNQIYLYGDKVIAVTSTGGGYIAVPFMLEPIAVDVAVGEVAGAAGSVGTADSEPAQTVPGDGVDGVAPDVDVAPYQFERPKTIVTVVDVTDRAAPTILSKTAFDGSSSSSRLVDGVLHLIVSNYQSYYYDVFPMLGEADVNVAENDTAAVLPKYTRLDADGTESGGNVVTWENMYRPEDPDGFGVVTVISVDIDDNASFTSVGVAAQPGLVYSSTAALYLTDTDYTYWNDLRETTDIYKFTYEGRGAVASATGTVPGRVLNQYSMGEYQGNLRVASTVSAQWGIMGQVTQSNNNVYVLTENADSLDVIGSVTGIAPGERIQSARFVGTRGFVVTFREMDPLFTLDMGDPTNPKIIGELEVPGFSTFIVPMDDNHLLTVGRYISVGDVWRPSSVQLSIYDITDFSQPRVDSNVILGDGTGAWSEALDNPKAFTYFAESGLVALPLSIYEDYLFLNDIAVGVDGTTSGGGATDTGGATDAVPPPDSTDPSVVEPTDPVDPYVPGGFEGVVVFSATVEGGLSEIGRISTRYPDAGIYYSSFTRGVFIGDDCLAVTDKGIRRAGVSDIETVKTELVFE